MKKLFERHEISFCILIIILYVFSNSYCMQKFGLMSFKSALINTLFSIFLITLIFLLGRFKYYGINKVKKLRKYLFFIPLIFISSVNLWNGININNSNSEIVFYIITMINVGFIEEIIFRGFLFKMIEKYNVNRAIALSSLTFGLGHIVNLFNGAQLIPTLFQICYAVSIGYLFVIIFYKSKSLLPCIFTHIIFNSLSIFSSSNNLSEYQIPLFLFLVSINYALYIRRIETDDNYGK